MFVRETAERCSTCRELTPHSRRLIALPKVLGAALLVGAGWCWAGDAAGWVPGGVLLGLAGLWLLLRDREEHWGIRCERCRRRKQAGVRSGDLSFGSHTEINLL